MAGGQFACEELAPHFDAEPRDSEFAKLVDTLAPGFCCESGRVSGRSRGIPVRNDELLARVVVGPKGIMPPTFVARADAIVLSLIGAGYSTLRVTTDGSFALDIARLARFLVDKAAKGTPVGDHAYCAGVIEFTAGAARGFRLASLDRQFLGAYETPEVDYMSHSDVLLAMSAFTSKGKAKNAARDFFDRQMRYIPVNQYDRADLSGIMVAGRLAAA